MLIEWHPFVDVYRQAFELTQNNTVPDYHLRLHFLRATDRRRYNEPAAQYELAAIIPGDVDMCVNSRDVIIRPKGGPLLCVSECNAGYIPLQFPLLAPTGQLGWNTNIPYYGGPAVIPNEDDNDGFNQRCLHLAARRPVAATSTFGLQVPTPPSYGAQELPCPIATLRHRRGMRASPRRYDSDTASQRHDCDAVPQRHDCDAVPQRHDCDAVPQRHDCDAVPQRYDCDAVPQRYDCDAVPQRYDCDAVPQRYDCDAVPRRHDCDAVPRRYDCDAVPQHHDCNAAPQRHDCDMALAPQRYDSDVAPRRYNSNTAPQRHDCGRAAQHSDTPSRRDEDSNTTRGATTATRRRGVTKTATRRAALRQRRGAAAWRRQRHGEDNDTVPQHGEDGDTAPWPLVYKSIVTVLSYT
ncbi:hypothetical protein EDB84DRAFT_1580941 [Lactarius hengduanensis]|nr:hypothetical protein EDB84DRAFT_1580941 [Lactarius hengduanensis]